MEHELIDRRSIALHRAIADKLRANPALLTIAHDNIARWMPAAGGTRPYYEAWLKLLALPLDELLRLLTEDSERMRALRQTTPFAGVLSPQERWAIYDLFPQPGTAHAALRS